jgi:UDP-N-acetylglucosamine/UDP-N-acetylgalactosamine diphosphorylase
MIQFPGYETIIKKVYEYKQDHLFAYWNELNETEKKAFLDELSTIDFASLIGLFRETQQEATIDSDYGPAPYIPRPRNDAEKKEWDKAAALGVDLIRKGKVAGFIVAGGQGSRLGYDGPKGAFRMSPVMNKSLFQIHAEKMKKYSIKYNVIVPLFIMTSDVNHAATVAHFEENNYFGMDKKDVFLFQQNMIPSLDTNGKLILSGKCSIFKNPDGHGGSLTALRTSSALDEMKKRGIEIMTYIQVDNPLVNIVDPSFVGFHAMNGADISSKALIKAYPEEKIGSFVKFSSGKEGVVEYSDLPKEKMFAKNADGTLLFAPGSIAIHVFSRQFIEEITSGGSISLPFHVARKKIKQYQPAGAVEIDGFKFEKFVFDAMPLAKKSVTIETIREEEFAPVKNATGIDSVDTSQELMSNLFKSWCVKRKISIPSKVRVIEISPLAAVEADDLDGSVIIPDQEKVYIG